MPNVELQIWGDQWHKDYHTHILYSPQVAGSSVIELDRKMADSVVNAERTPPKDQESVRKLAEDIYTAFSTIAFVYFKNQGISDTEVNY